MEILRNSDAIFFELATAIVSSGGRDLRRSPATRSTMVHSGRMDLLDNLAGGCFQEKPIRRYRASAASARYDDASLIFPFLSDFQKENDGRYRSSSLLPDEK